MCRVCEMCVGMSDFVCGCGKEWCVDVMKRVNDVYVYVVVRYVKIIN